MKLKPHKSITWSNRIELTSVPPQSIDQLKALLTFPNPAYEQASRFSKWGAPKNISETIFAYEETEYGISVPIGTPLQNIDGLHLTPVYDERIINTVSYPEFVFALRDEQFEAAQTWLINFKFGVIVLPTGKGKTVLSLFLAQYLKQKTLILVHKDDLVQSFNEDIRKCFNNKVTPGLFKAKKRIIGEQITIATVQTFNRLSDSEKESMYNLFGMVVVDECHHCPASSFTIVNEFKARHKLGLTATLERADGLKRVIELNMGPLRYEYKYQTDDKDVLPVEVITRNVPVYYNPVCRDFTEYIEQKPKWKIVNEFAREDAKLGKLDLRITDVEYKYRPDIRFGHIEDYVITQPVFQDSVVRDIINEYKQGHSCVVFFKETKHLEEYYWALENEIESLCTYYGGNNARTNKEVLEYAQKTRQTVTLTTYAKATEGTNCPQWEVCFLVSSLSDQKNVQQAVGRVRRSHSTRLPFGRVYDYRCPKVYMMASHAGKRDQRYRQMKAKFVIDKPKDR